jgi:hypothetical protein
MRHRRKAEGTLDAMASPPQLNNGTSDEEEKERTTIGLFSF